MATNDGGPAFPTQHFENSAGEVVIYASEGMSLRDFFAAKAMAGLLTDNDALAIIEGDEATAQIAARAYAIADSMLAARDKAEG